MRKVILWFRQDLRLHDNEALVDALSVADEILPVYVFDPRVFRGETIFGFEKTGDIRAAFIRQSVIQLREQLRELGSDLVIRVGNPEDELFVIANQYKSSWIFCNRERTPEEVAVQDALEQQLWSIGQEVRYTRGKMLLYTQDLPFPVTHTPDNFGTFKKETERIIPIREPFAAPKDLPGFTGTIALGEIPDLGTLTGRGPCDGLVANCCLGGETEALRVLSDFRESLIDGTYSDDEFGDMLKPRFSPWMSQGCLSPKMLYAAITEGNLDQHPEVQNIVEELYYRDYLRLMVKKYGNQIFEANGITDEKVVEDQSAMSRFELWAKGVTGIPIIDAGMRQLNRSGYIPEKLRMLLAIFLIKELEVPWRCGASYFESKLIDYDPCSNWVNWANIAGVGPDSRETRALNYVLQAKRIDPDGEFVKEWIPALKNADANWIHQPDQADDELREGAGLLLGKDYPKAIFSTDRWQ